MIRPRAAVTAVRVRRTDGGRATQAPRRCQRPPTASVPARLTRRVGPRVRVVPVRVRAIVDSDVANPSLPVVRPRNYRTARPCNGIGEWDPGAP